MFAFVDAFVLVAILGLARSGWRRGASHMFLDAIGFAAATGLAFRFHAIPEAFLVLFGVSVRWAPLAGGAVLFVPIILATAYVGWKVRKLTMQPGLHLTDKVLGAALGVALAAAGLVVLVALSQRGPVPEFVGDVVRRSPTASTLLDAARPVARALDDMGV